MEERIETGEQYGEDMGELQEFGKGKKDYELVERMLL